MGIREALRKLRQEVSRETTTLTCPTCGQRFVVYGENPPQRFLKYYWRRQRSCDHPDSPDEEVLSGDLRRVAAHEHDSSLLLDETGEPWLGTFFAGNLSAYEEPTRDLSEQEQEE